MTRFSLDRHRILDPQGRMFTPVGVNGCISMHTDADGNPPPYTGPFAFEGLPAPHEPGQGGGLNTHTRWSTTAGRNVTVDGGPRISDYRERWGFNTYRANLPLEGEAGPTADRFRAHIARGVVELADAGIVVILEPHWLTAANPHEVPETLYDFYRWAMLTFGDHPNVWMNCANEPHTERMAQWQDFHGQAVDILRNSMGWESPIVLDLPRWAQDGFAIDAYADSLREWDVIAGWHAYGSIRHDGGTLDDHRAVLDLAEAEGVPLLIGEFGYPNGLDQLEPWMRHTEPACRYLLGTTEPGLLDEYPHVGALWWTGTGDTAYRRMFSLTADPARPMFDPAAPLSFWGDRFAQYAERADTNTPTSSPQAPSVPTQPAPEPPTMSAPLTKFYNTIAILEVDGTADVYNVRVDGPLEIRLAAGITSEAFSVDLWSPDGADYYDVTLGGDTKWMPSVPDVQNGRVDHEGNGRFTIAGPTSRTSLRMDFLTGNGTHVHVETSRFYTPAEFNTQPEPLAQPEPEPEPPTPAPGYQIRIRITGGDDQLVTIPTGAHVAGIDLVT